MHPINDSTDAIDKIFQLFPGIGYAEAEKLAAEGMAAELAGTARTRAAMGTITEEAQWVRAGTEAADRSASAQGTAKAQGGSSKGKPPRAAASSAAAQPSAAAESAATESAAAAPAKKAAAKKKGKGKGKRKAAAPAPAAAKPYKPRKKKEHDVSSVQAAGESSG